MSIHQCSKGCAGILLSLVLSETTQQFYIEYRRKKLHASFCFSICPITTHRLKLMFKRHIFMPDGTWLNSLYSSIILFEISYPIYKISRNYL